MLLLVEIMLLDGAYSFRDLVGGEPSPAWRVFNDTLQVLIYVALYAGVAFCFLAFAQSRAIISDWLTAARGHGWGRWLGAQTLLFLALLAALPALTGGGERAVLHHQDEVPELVQHQRCLSRPSIHSNFRMEGDESSCAREVRDGGAGADGLVGGVDDDGGRSRRRHPADGGAGRLVRGSGPGARGRDACAADRQPPPREAR